MIELDGSYEEGGGQILRTALGLSVYTQKGFRITNIRLGRKEPGLKRQHLEAIKVAQTLSHAKTTPYDIGTTELTFEPGAYTPKNLEIDIGTAGSITLLLQSLWIPLIFGKKSISLKIIGGTDVKHSIPSDYIKHVFIPHLKKYADIEFILLRRGYYPKGGGQIHLTLKPTGNRENIQLTEQGDLLKIQGIAHASLPLQHRDVAERMADRAERELQKLKCPIELTTHYSDSYSDGAGIVLWSIHSETILGTDSLGERHITAENVGLMAAHKLMDEIRSRAAVDRHLTDNLIPFIGIVGGKMKTSKITKHTISNIYVAETFLEVKYHVDEKNKIIIV